MVSDDNNISISGGDVVQTELKTGITEIPLTESPSEKIPSDVIFPPIKMSLSNYSVDNFVAPHLSELTVNNAPELIMDQQDCWVRNFILNTLFRLKPIDPYRQLIYNFLRKTESAIHEYANARLLLGEYIDQGKDAISKYLTAVLHFETCLAQAYQAYMLAKNIIRQDEAFKLFDNGD